MDLDDLEKNLEATLVLRQTPGSGDYRSIAEAHLLPLAQTRGETLKEVMILCLKNDIWPERFRAQRGTFTALEQAGLLQSTVAIIGAGGLGGTLVHLLARIGVGHLIICDGDRFEESNLNRQLLSNTKRLGKNKAECAREDIADLNPVTTITSYPVWAAADNIRDMLSPAQVVIDALDNMATRYLVESAAENLGIPFIHGALAGREGMLMTVFPGEPGLRNVYGPLPASKEHSAETVLGTPTITPSLIAGLQAHEAVNVLLGNDVISRSRLLHLDLTDMSIGINRIV
jgi:molybdopterin-synthase adenylyltransferase